MKLAVLVFPGATADLVREQVPPDAFVVAADAGAEALRGADRVPDVLVGDLDSVSPETLAWARASGARVEAHPPQKDFTDGDLALRAAQGCDGVVFLGSGGGRADHALGNLHLLYRASLTMAARAVDADAFAWFATPGRPVELDLAKGSLVSVLPFTGVADGVTLTGFGYPLTDARLAPGTTVGLSNVAVAPRQRIEVASGALLVMAPRIA